MASLQEYVRKLRREQLEQMLRESCDCEVCDPILMLTLCDALSRFDPELPDPYEAFRHLCRQYLR